MPDWDFRIRGYAGGRHPREIRPGTLLLETTHKGEASASIEIECWQERMKRGEVSKVELIDMRPRGKLTDLNVHAHTVVPWSWRV